MSDGAGYTRRRYINRERSFPACLELQTITVCNARCSVCPYEAVNSEQHAGRMSDELIERLLAQFAEHASEIDLIVPYFNNEPFADKRMIEILRNVRRIDIPIELSTNGSLLTEDRLRAIATERLVQVFRFSVFGATKDTYERRMRGLKWETIVATLERAITILDPGTAIEIIMVAAPDLTADEFGLAKARWQAENVSVKLFGYLDRAGNCTDRNLLPLNQQIGRIIGCDLNRPFERMAVRYDGTCVLCSQDWRGQIVLGNASQSCIQDIWQGSSYSHVRDQISGKIWGEPQLLCRQCKLALVE